jgi:hypothetical protein
MWLLFRKIFSTLSLLHPTKLGSCSSCSVDYSKLLVYFMVSLEVSFFREVDRLSRDIMSTSRKEGGTSAAATV